LNCFRIKGFNQSLGLHQTFGSVERIISCHNLRMLDGPVHLSSRDLYFYICSTLFINMFVIHTTTLLIESINTTINFSKFILNREGKDMIERNTKHDKQNNVLQMLNKNKGLVA